MLSIREKVAYGLGDTASNFVFQTVILLMSFFYTDIFGLAPGIVGTLFLVVRIFDAVTDPLMGALTDRTRSRHGRYRPYLLWLSGPFALITILAFTTPDFSETGKVWYAFITYTMLMAIYTAINIPYSAMAGTLTADNQERVSLQGYRFFFGMLGGLVVTSLTLPMTDWLGGGDMARGYQLAMTVLSVVGFVLFLLCFLGTRERVVPTGQSHGRLRADFLLLLKNDQWRILCAVATLVLAGLVMRTTLTAYYVKAFLDLSAWHARGYSVADLITLFITTGMVGGIIGVSLAPAMTRRFGKIRTYRMALLGAAMLSLASYWIPAHAVIPALILYAVWNMTLQAGTPILWAFMSDVVDYGHARSGVRINGITFSTVIFFIKLGVAFGGALAGWSLAFYGYDSSVPASIATRNGILLSHSVAPALCFLAVAAIMARYRLTQARLAALRPAILSCDGQDDTLRNQDQGS
ncbi:glycoside-pentoside-hexuronide (GPH):cation symporter [Yunchengibacter salinarum]|uniref:glycoside-pentoside-hexuronide (GPH):cation symporter n=1 Tax=Yunchengibacter salinarum TaxID=3133399 RepID=UPI0035B5F2DF